MELNETVDYHIKATWHSIAGMYNRMATEHGISQTIGYVLLNIEKEGIPATQIAPLLGMQVTSLSRLLKNMESDGLIYRKPHETDKRVVLIFLTEKGIKKRTIARDAVYEFNKKVYKKLDKNELNQMFDTMATINQLAIEVGSNH